MNISLTPELESFIQGKVQSGRYASASEVIREAVRLLEEYEATRTHQIRELRERVDTGLASIARGEGADGEVFMKNLLGTLDQRRKNSRRR
ncbi:MAG: type II toxin-antitoxin system ParD family antitoxin [Acidobacteriaceae bacterium]|nr:type II toxin-antitoxin system ParD family antitoxin [Acidobacteriaceae bacterium]